MEKYKTEAKIFADAIRTFADNPAAIDNIENYLSHHFGEWMKKFAYDPETMAAEMKHFSQIA